MLVSRDEPGTLAQPGAATIPSAPSVAPPVAPVTTSAEEKPLVASPLSEPSPPVDELAPGKSSQALVAPNLDQAESEDDRESVREIRARLSTDKALARSARQVSVVAKNGRVRLSGQVNTAEQRAAIERAARQAANVRDVRNELVVLE